MTNEQILRRCMTTIRNVERKRSKPNKGAAVYPSGKADDHMRKAINSLRQAILHLKVAEILKNA
jgi:hypothetical protein